ncbi:Hypothetical predicted protein, partial [Mytilus galloprovincialis]
SIGAIVGIVIGGLFVIGITITFIAALCGALCFSKRSHRSVTSVPSNNIAVVTAHPGYPQMQPMNQSILWTSKPISSTTSILRKSKSNSSNGNKRFSDTICSKA